MPPIKSLHFSKARLEGVRRVTSTLRPLRQVFLVDPDKISSVLKAVAVCSSSWGGVQQFLVPCRANEAPDQVWSEFIDIHDPDDFVDLVGASKDFTDFQDQKRDRYVVRWEFETEKAHSPGTSVFSSLRNLEADEVPKDLVCPHLLNVEQGDEALRLAFRWGVIDDTLFDPKRLTFNSLDVKQYDDYVKLEPLNSASLSDELRSRICQQPITPFTNENNRLGWKTPFGISLLDLTTIGAEAGMTWHDPLDFNPEKQLVGPPHFHCVVVVGPRDSVPDFCLAWNLRARGRTNSPFPLWLTDEELSDPDIVRMVETVRRAAAGSWLHRDLDPHVRLVSATIGDERLQAIATAIPKTFTRPSSRTLELLPARYRPGPSLTSISHFSNGSADVQLPGLSKVGRFHELETLGVSIDIADWNPPQVRASIFSRGSHVASRIATDGVAGHLRLFAFNSHDLFSVTVQSSWEILRLLAEKAGYAVKVSDAGKRAIAVLNLLENSGDLSILASSKVYSLILDLARIVPRTAVQSALNRRFDRTATQEEVDAMVAQLQSGTLAEGQYDRPHYNADKIHRVLAGIPACISKQETAWLIKWLLDRRILFRGYEPTCPECGFRRWYPVDHLGAIHHCEGCQQDIDLPLSVDTPLYWTYRLNEAVALSVDKGFYPHLLAIRRMIDMYSSRSSWIGISPGLDFTPLPGNDLPPIEVDVFGIHDTDIILGECKANGAELNENDKVERIGQFANRIGASKIFYASLTNFDSVAATIEHAKHAALPIDVELYDATTMTDPAVGPSQPHPSAEEYLKTLIKRRLENER